MKVRYFNNATEITTFVNTPANNVQTVVSITFDDGSGKYVLFYY